MRHSREPIARSLVLRVPPFPAPATPPPRRSRLAVLSTRPEIAPALPIAAVACTSHADMDAVSCSPAPPSAQSRSPRISSLTAHVDAALLPPAAFALWTRHVVAADPVRTTSNDPQLCKYINRN
ncbi:hypothetical protein AURDEDRAFT_174455 [Auricularia subglabra TFB-10046 SS5]|uniref:Uncharacterized protein n=1 Tax=Auricularia subglabra (strain TFB-10046 / SS5) TaxID=717982 RepID=J0D9M0_AURST|nr:hypothetical protein AURDEDRAFT_174455 [Auricularia subglabra TFB-10046 SS5]